MLRNLLLIVFMCLSFNVKALTLDYDNFASGDVIADATPIYTQWYDIRHFYYIDFTVLATVGSGVMEVEYSSDPLGASLVVDPTSQAFDTTEAYSLIGAGVGKQYVRLKLTCTGFPCTYSGWFNAKGPKR